MSLHHYESGKTVQRLKHELDLPFYGIVQGLMRLADTENLAKLQAAWPEVWVDLQARYNAPGGILPEDADQAWREVDPV